MRPQQVGAPQWHSIFSPPSANATPPPSNSGAMASPTRAASRRFGLATCIAGDHELRTLQMENEDLRASLLAARILDYSRLAADILYLDSAHEKQETFMELVAFWPAIPSPMQICSWVARNEHGIYPRSL